MENGKVVCKLNLKLKRRLTKALTERGVDKVLIKTAIEVAEDSASKKQVRLTRLHVKLINEILTEKGIITIKLSQTGNIYFINSDRIKINDKRLDFLRSKKCITKRQRSK